MAPVSSLLPLFVPGRSTPVSAPVVSLMNTTAVSTSSTSKAAPVSATNNPITVSGLSQGSLGNTEHNEINAVKGKGEAVEFLMLYNNFRKKNIPLEYLTLHT